MTKVAASKGRIKFEFISVIGEDIGDATDQKQGRSKNKKKPMLSIINEPRHEISNNVVCATSKGSDQPAHTHRLIRAFASRLNIL